MVGVFMGISLPFTRHCTGFSPARQPGLEDVLQGKLFGLVEQGDLGHEPGVGGGVLPGLLAGEELEHLLKTGIDLIGVGMAQEDVQVAVPGLPLCEGLLCEDAGFLPVPGLRPGLRLLQKGVQRPGKAPQIEVVAQRCAEQDSQQQGCDPQPLLTRPSFSAR